jgi:hypothetical protein
MSQKKEYTINCPRCGAVQQVELHDAVNVTQNPELRDLLMTNELNKVTCNECAFEFRVDKHLLYHDSKHRFMIYWIPLGQLTITQGEQQFNESITTMNRLIPESIDFPQIHLVFQRVELVERIFLLEQGLDERLIEYIKYLIYSKNMEKVPPETKSLLFNAQDSTDESLCFVVQDVNTLQLEGLLQYERKAYKALSEMFDCDDHTADIFELFPGPYISARMLLLRESEEALNEDGREDASH